MLLVFFETILIKHFRLWYILREHEVERKATIHLITSGNDVPSVSGRMLQKLRQNPLCNFILKRARRAFKKKFIKLCLARVNWVIHMGFVRRGRVRLFLGATVLGIAGTFASTLYVSESTHRIGLLPCVMLVFHIPLKIISRGFPLFWLFYTEGVDQIGCGPIVGHFSTYSICAVGLLVDVAFYSLSALGTFYAYHKLRAHGLAEAPSDATT